MPVLYQPGCTTRQAASNTYRVGHACRAGFCLKMGHFLPTHCCCVDLTRVSDTLKLPCRQILMPCHATMVSADRSPVKPDPYKAEVYT